LSDVSFPEVGITQVGSAEVGSAEVGGSEIKLLHSDFVFSTYSIFLLLASEFLLFSFAMLYLLSLYFFLLNSMHVRRKSKFCIRYAMPSLCFLEKICV
jgi:hypothetical protein